MKTLNKEEVELVVGGGIVGELGYSVGYGLGYLIGGGAGRDLGNWLYDTFN